jgi:[ribosomal protein S5]-alanine N-acetyltransferase
MTRQPNPGNAPEHNAYFLQSERLGFRSWSDADMDLAMALWGDPEVTRLIGGAFSRAQVQERLSGEIATMQSHGIQYWPVFLLTTGEHVGCCGLRPYKSEEGICEIGVHLRKAFWGQGFAPEATRAVIEYAFNILGVKALFAGHNPANEASRRLLEKLGFRYTHDEYYSPTGLDHPSYLLASEEFGREQKQRTGGFDKAV